MTDAKTVFHQPRNGKVPAQKKGLFFLCLCRNHPSLPVNLIEAGFAKLATKEVNHVPILFGDYGINRCQCCFYWRAGGVGRQGVSQKEGSRRNRPELE